MWAHTAGVEVRVAGGGVDGVLLKVFTDVLRGGLRQQPVQTLPGTTEQIQRATLKTLHRPKDVF